MGAGPAPRCHTDEVAPVELQEDIERAADPAAVSRVLERIARAQPDGPDRWRHDARLRAGLIAVADASPWLSRVCITDPAALDVLSDLDPPAGDPGAQQEPGPAIARAKRLGLLRIAARDLLGLDRLEAVGAELSDLAAQLLQAALVGAESTALAVIGMGKLGGRELNYASDVDVVLVAPDREPGGPAVRRVLDLARSAWRIDLDLRPEGRAGPLVRSLSSYAAYWDRWAETWEFQALLKARAVAGDPTLGGRFEQEATARVWGRPFGAEEVRQVRQMKARGEEAVSRQGLWDRELKRGKGGIRDIEFAVQLLQMVHGRADGALRSPATLPALAALAAGGYIAGDDSDALESAYRFLRTVEHRLQLYEDEQVHTVPTGEARVRLARVLGYRDQRSGTAVTQFEADWRRHQARVRAIHERLFFRPLLEAFAAPRPGGAVAPQQLTDEAAADRLSAFGFTDPERTARAIQELTRGFSRSSQLMAQALPMLLDWLSDAPDPELGLLGLRTLSTGAHHRDQLTALCRESPEGARQLCQLLGTGPRFARAFQGHPDLLAGLATGQTLVDRTRVGLDELIAGTLAWRSGEGAAEAGLRHAVRAETLRVAARDVLDLADVDATGRALSDLAESAVTAALRAVNPPLPFVIAGMGRLGRPRPWPTPATSTSCSSTKHRSAWRPPTPPPRRKQRPAPSSAFSPARPRPLGCTGWTPRYARRGARDRWPAASRPTPPTTSAGPRSGNAKPSCEVGSSWATPAWAGSSARSPAPSSGTAPSGRRKCARSAGPRPGSSGSGCRPERTRPSISNWDPDPSPTSNGRRSCYSYVTRSANPAPWPRWTPSPTAG